ncbi:unnamed protein product [Didymodactylos carnosus]|uniref:Uncharacterized protein n=1 Tax=Didymodactylos carnosus TaxID=1234261 RepID=A0A815DG40_9BILA|nr:unnamed protein product [Didymodactylos carnosus]CAF1300419.1 unnamed protein product [Didymodactylos carnosus]CAF3904017.1 unnamed protein product [Didymodactylos carnosus]CAF4123259.1 unnamed protein product [Didymodactylos carnosus]
MDHAVVVMEQQNREPAQQPSTNNPSDPSNKHPDANVTIITSAAPPGQSSSTPVGPGDTEQSPAVKPN